MIRRAAKVIVIGDDDTVLLFRGGDPATPDAGTFWFPPGGGVEPGESLEDAARRELQEETGLLVDDLGPIVAHRRVDVSLNNSSFVSDEQYFALLVSPFAVEIAGWTDLEREVIVEHRWWPIDELRTTAETVYPEGLVSMVDSFVLGDAGRSRGRGAG